MSSSFDLPVCLTLKYLKLVESNPSSRNTNAFPVDSWLIRVLCRVMYSMKSGKKMVEKIKQDTILYQK